jgi:hypothetical protein
MFQRWFGGYSGYMDTNSEPTPENHPVENDTVLAHINDPAPQPTASRAEPGAHEERDDTTVLARINGPGQTAEDVEAAPEGGGH